MSIEWNTIISLETGERCVVLEETNYEGTTYYILMGVDSNNDIMEHDIRICYECGDSEETFIDFVKDWSLITFLTERVMQQIRQALDED